MLKLKFLIVFVVLFSLKVYNITMKREGDFFMKKKIKFIITFLVILIFFITFLIFFQNNTELRTIKSDKELTRIYNGDDSDSHHIYLSL